MKQFFLLISIFSLASIAQSTPPQLMVQLSGGLMFMSYDRKADDSWDIEYQESTVAALDISHSLFFHRDKFQLVYGIGGERLKNVSKLGPSRLETSGYGLILRAGMLYNPSTLPISFGHTLGFLVLDDYSTRFYSQGIQANITSDEFIFLDQMINSLWFKYSFSPNLKLFTRVDIRRLEHAVLSQNVGVEIAF